MLPDQLKTFVYDPVSGELHPYPVTAKGYRNYHWGDPWMFNPWTGDRRSPDDVLNDPQGLLI